MSVQVYVSDGERALVLTMPEADRSAMGYVVETAENGYQAVTQEQYKGAVLRVWHIEGHWDNYNDPGHDCALIWSEGSTKVITCSNGRARVDATAEVQAAHAAYEAEMAAQRRAAEAAAEERTVRRGKIVTVNRGRKVPKGTEGEVFWIGNNGYGQSVGLALADGSKVFTALKNVDVKLDSAGKAIEAPKRPVERREAPQGIGRGALVQYKGATGEVFWIGEAKNGSGVRVGVKFDNGNKDFLAGWQVEVIKAA